MNITLKLNVKDSLNHQDNKKLQMEVSGYLYGRSEREQVEGIAQDKFEKIAGYNKLYKIGEQVTYRMCDEKYAIVFDIIKG